MTVSGTRKWRQSVLSKNGPASATLDFSGPLFRIVTGLTITVAIVSLAVCGYVLHGWSWQDGLYMVIITIFGVGYGETQPVDTPGLRWLTILLIISGYIAAIYTVGGFVQLLIDGEFRRILGIRRMHKEIDALQGHVIICGFGRMGSKLAEQLASSNQPLVVVEMEERAIQRARQAGHLALQGNATEESTLKSAGVERASILTTVLSDDVSNLFITITTRDLNPNVKILARAEQNSTIKKLRQVGASNVILPAMIGADRLANMILRPSAEVLFQQKELTNGLNDDLASIGLRLEELQIKEGSGLIGSTVGDLIDRSSNRFLMIALRSPQNPVLLQPEPSHQLAAGESIVMLGHSTELFELCQKFQLETEPSD